MATEQQLVKALADMEALAGKGDRTISDKLPKTTDQANGGFSNEGDPNALATTGSEGSPLDDWTRKGGAPAAGDDDSESSSSDSESSSSDDPASKATISDIIKSNSASSPVVDVSPFLETLVDTVSTSDMQLRKALVAMKDEQSGFNDSLRKSVVALGNLTLEIKKSLDQLMDAPAGQRRAVLSKSEITEPFEQPQADFSKSQILDTMFDLLKSGEQGITPVDITRYEGTNDMEPNVRRLVEGALRKGL